MKAEFIRCPRQCPQRRPEGCLLTGCINRPLIIEQNNGVIVTATKEGMIAPFMIISSCYNWYGTNNRLVNCIEACSKCRAKQTLEEIEPGRYYLECTHYRDPFTITPESKCFGMFEPREAEKE